MLADRIVRGPRVVITGIHLAKLRFGSGEDPVESGWSRVASSRGDSRRKTLLLLSSFTGLLRSARGEKRRQFAGAICRERRRAVWAREKFYTQSHERDTRVVLFHEIENGEHVRRSRVFCAVIKRLPWYRNKRKINARRWTERCKEKNCETISRIRSVS